MMKKSVAAMLLLMAFSVWPNILVAQVSGESPTCGPVNGKTPKDRDNALAFCKQSVVRGAVVGVITMESLVWIKVGRNMADAMRADRLNTEQAVKNWMTGWKKVSGSKAVTVHVEWQDVEIARGQTTVLSGDQVTIR